MSLVEREHCLRYWQDTGRFFNLFKCKNRFSKFASELMTISLNILCSVASDVNLSYLKIITNKQDKNPNKNRIFFLHVFRRLWTKWTRFLWIVLLRFVIFSPGSTITFVMKKDDVNILPDISFLCFLKEKKIIQVWINMRVSKWWHFSENYPFTAKGQKAKARPR